jgi:hypothetical protein
MRIWVCPTIYSRNCEETIKFLGEVNVVRREVSCGEFSATIDCLTVNGKPVPLEQFETIPEESLGSDSLGYVNLHDDACAGLGEHFHLL